MRSASERRAGVMERLWAPWRMEYITAANREGCIFCIGNDRKMDKERLVIFRSESCFVMLNRYPYSNGHLMVIPYRHSANLDELDPEELLDLMETLRLSGKILGTALRPEGYNIGMNIGKVSGAGVADHLHFHIVPRWNGDTNFMTVLSDTRVVPESLTSSYDKLKPLFPAIR